MPTIHVGCRHFGHGRLQALVNCKGLEPVACVDIDVEGSRVAIGTLTGDVPADLADRVYTSITEARQRHEASVCLIFASTTAHEALVVESLGLGMHTLCVKPIACSQDEFRSMIAAHRKRPDLMLVQGQNKRWNPAAAKMREWLREENGIGEMIGGECRFWIRQNLWTGKDTRQPDAFVEGLYFHAGASHQLDQLVAAKGLPAYVTARVHKREDVELGQTGVWGTAGGNALMEYANGACVSYAGTRAGHANPFGWSGHWTFQGERGDIRRDAGHLQLFRKDECVEDVQLQDLHAGLIEDDRIQFDALADAITTGKDRDWMGHSLDTWVLMEALNASARTLERVDVGALRASLFA
ncbi:Gfo/Idh/MocA family oxidoreductase [Candidatus Poribacteria bacterium]|nr:Gfo/Idh/MocA family oxidoreductase [Candidatus Poribacteria bacterium]